MLRRLATNTLLNMATYAVRIAASLVLTPLLIRALGHEAYGVWILGSAFWLGGIVSFIDLGIAGSIVRFVARDEARGLYAKVSEVINAGLGAFLILGVVACLLVHAIRLYAIGNVISVPLAQIGVARGLLAILAWQLLLEFPNIAFSATLEGLQRYPLLRGLEMLQSLLFLLLAWGLVTVRPDVVALGWLLFGLTAVRTVATGLLVRRYCPYWSLRTRPSRATFREVAVFSAQLLAIRLNALVYNNVDKLVIGVMLSSTLLADYDVVYRLYALVLICLSLVSQMVVPAASQLAATGDNGRIEQLKFWGTRTTVAMTCPVAAATMILAEPLLRYWIGPSFAGNAFAARLFVGYLLFWALVPVGYNILIGTGRVVDLLRVQVPTTVLNLVLSIALAPRLGITGVIAGTFIGNLVAWSFYMPMFFGAGATLKRFVMKVVVPSYSWVAISAATLAVVVLVRPPRTLVQTAVLWTCDVTLFWVLYVLFGTEANERRALNAVAGGWLGRLPLLGSAFPAVEVIVGP